MTPQADPRFQRFEFDEQPASADGDNLQGVVGSALFGTENRRD
jgi:hypothetical protein